MALHKPTLVGRGGGGGAAAIGKKQDWDKHSHEGGVRNRSSGSKRAPYPDMHRREDALEMCLQLDTPHQRGRHVGHRAGARRRGNLRTTPDENE